MTCRSKSSVGVVNKSVVFIKFLPGRAAQCRVMEGALRIFEQLGKALASGLGNLGVCFTIFGARRFGIWSEWEYLSAWR
jgi:hypothetical protein